MELPEIESVLANLAEEWAAVLPDECLACYLDRTMPQFGCRELTLTTRWNAAQSHPVAGLERWLRLQGGWCDCEVVLNVLLSGRRTERHKQIQCARSFKAYQDEGQDLPW